MIPKKLLCIGDSLTSAYEVPFTSCWTHLLATSLNIETLNHGISGDTTAGMLARFQLAVESATPKMVVLMGGTNDLSMQVPLPVILANLMAMIRYGRHLTIPVIIGIPPAVVSTDSVPEIALYRSKKQLGDRMNSFQQELKEFAQIEADGFIDFSEGLNNNHYMEDGLHLNIKGHAIMSTTAVKALSTYLRPII